MPKQPSSPRLYTIPNAAKILGVSRQRLHALIKSGHIQPTNVPGVGRAITSQELNKFQHDRAAKKPFRRRPRQNQQALTKSQLALPVQPFPALLNLHDPNFSWQNFEKFCEDFVSLLPEVKEVHVYGRRGGRQKGIDLVADMKNGQRWGFQARQWRKFGKTHIHKAIAKTTYQADRYVLLVSSEAGDEERDICDQSGKWEIWDVRDISRKVRHDIPLNAAARLVEASFGPQWRRYFLGLTGLEPLVTPEEYFRPLLDATKLFHHRWPLVGRLGAIESLNGLVGSHQYRVAILTGRGGIGKTKVLHAFAEQLPNQHPEYSVRFLAEGVPLSADSFDHIPISPLVIVVDDAHRTEDLASILIFAQQRQYRHPEYPVKLILSTRPQGLSRVRTFLTQAGFDPREITEIPEVKELDRKDAKELAAQVLGKTNAHFVDRLAAATRDSPLVTVVGGRLLKERRIDPALLENDDEFRRAVLTRFQDAILGTIGGKVDAATARRALQLIATLGPVNFGNDAVVQKAGEFLSVDRDVLLSTVGLLEEYGILIRRGRTIRITPDVLADHILREACINPQGLPTGYAYKVFRSFASVQPANVLRNLAELDWRMHHTIGDSGLLNDIWKEIERGFRESPHSARCAILDILEEVAYFQPRRVMDIVEFAIRNPAQTAEDPSMARLYTYSHKDVLDRLPKLLRRISFNLDYLSRSCDLLWKLGRDDPRETNPNPDHPMRILTDIAGYDVDKPLVVNETILAAVTRWLSAPDAHAYRYSPLDVIEPLFAKTSYSTHTEGHSFVFRPFKVHQENTKGLRANALNIVLECARSHKIQVVFKALDTLEEALRGPIGLFGQKISEEDKRLWLPDQLQVIEALEGIAKTTRLPLVKLRVIEILRWYARYEGSKDIRNRAREVIHGIKPSQGLRLFRVLKNSFDLESDEEGGVDYKQRDQASREFRQDVADEFLKAFPQPVRGFSQLNRHLTILSKAEIQHNASTFLYALSQTKPSYAERLCKALVQHPKSALAPYLAVLLSGVRKTNQKQAMKIIEGALDTGDLTLCRSVADGYRVWLDNPTDDDWPILKRLINHNDQNVKLLTLLAMERLAHSDQKLAKDLALTVDIGDNPVLAERISELFHPKWGIPLDALSDDELKNLLERMRPISTLDDYHISEFLSNASKRLPVAVVQLLLDRIAWSTKTADSKYRPLPHQFQHRLTGLAQTKDYKHLLRKVRDLALKRNWRPRFWGAYLFKEISLGFSPESLALLNEWIESGKERKIEAAAALLREADSDFVFANRDFVVKLLQNAHAADGEYLKKVAAHLFASAISGVRSGAPGEPMPQDIALRDQADSIARDLPAGSPEHTFYHSLARHAEHMIRQHLIEDEEIFD